MHGLRRGEQRKRRERGGDHSGRFQVLQAALLQSGRLRQGRHVRAADFAPAQQVVLQAVGEVNAPKMANEFEFH